MKVSLIFRKKQNAFFSIEKVFGSLLPFFQKRFTVEQVFLPHHTQGLLAIFKNILFTRNIKGSAVYHVTGDIHYAVLGLPRSRTILTIHDCVFLYNYTGFKRMFLKWILLDMPVRGARIVTTISEKSKAEIVKFSNCNPDKVVVIGNPLNDHIYFSARKFDSANPRILFIGTTPNKNLDRVATALKGIDCRLVILGKLNSAQQTMLQEMQIAFEMHSGLTEMQVADLYAGCDVVMFPSTYEGFGLPILESQKAGRVIITSNISPMKEVAGAGACLVDPMNESSIRDSLLKIVQNEPYREEIIALGLENIKKYEAAEIAGQYARLYNSIAEN